MNIEELQLLLSYPNDKNIKFKLLNECIAEVTDLDWNNIILLLENFEENNKIFVLNLCTACMNMLYANEKKFITIKQFISTFLKISLNNRLEAYELLKPFVNCSAMKVEHILLLLNSKHKNIIGIKLKFLEDFVAELADLDWNNIVSLFGSFRGDNRVYVLKLCIVQMNNLCKNKKKYIAVEQFGLIIQQVRYKNELEIYELLKSFIDCSIMKIEDILLLMDSNMISYSLKFKILKDFIVELAALDWNNIVTLLENFNADDSMCALKLCIVQMNKLYKNTKKNISSKQFGLILKQVSTVSTVSTVSINGEFDVYELLRPFINIPTNNQNSFKFIKFILSDSQKIEYAKISFDNINLIPNTDLYSILGSMQDDIFKFKFVELFVDKIEISISNLCAIIELIPMGRFNIYDLFISKGLVTYFNI